jgi:hypothetical protein
MVAVLGPNEALPYHIHTYIVFHVHCCYRLLYSYLAENVFVTNNYYCSVYANIYTTWYTFLPFIVT